MDIKVLVIDDSKFIRAKLKELLEKDVEYRFIVDLCEDGALAIRYLCACKETQHLPDIIILDRNMPNMSGDECIRIIKEDDHWRSIPTLLLTAQVEKSEIAHGLLELKADDYLTKPFDDGEMLARVKVLVRLRLAEKKNRALIVDLEQANLSVRYLNQNLEKTNMFIRKTFGRYLSDEVVDLILESPKGLSLEGEKRQVTILMSDLRGFSDLSEHLPAEAVVKIINNYLHIMTEIIFKYQGIIDEFIGDAILAIFGAITSSEDDAQKAVACALEMQLAMNEVNQTNKKYGYPELSMGIGINTGVVVVGNIGSQKRTKYGVVGANVNLTSRIESYALGGQIFVSASTLSACADILHIEQQLQVYPKGTKEPIIVSEISGIKGKFNIRVPQKQQSALIKPPKTLLARFALLKGKNIDEILHHGTVVGLTKDSLLMETERVLLPLTNLKISLHDIEGRAIIQDVYAKVTKIISQYPCQILLVFASLPENSKKNLEDLLLGNSA